MMSRHSPIHVLICAIGVTVALTGCKREERQYRPMPPAASLDKTIRMSPIQPGQPQDTTQTKNDKEDSAYAVAEGQRLFRSYNCNGCHANGGGGMGPPLMDDKWIYGSDPANVVATILEGRPNGMPSFRGKIPDDQVWELAAYVRSMSGLLPKDVSPSRQDHMSAKNPESSTQALVPVEGGSAPPASTGTQQ
ncbi:MAG TPA: c-type cytochrome [Stellaceae bacterium]|jgi:cytochrome c oxidase cbb3-type subunit 3